MRVIAALLSFVLLLALGIAGFTAWSARRNAAPSAGPERFPRLAPFMAGREDFRAVVNDLNSTHYVFEITTSHATADRYFAAVHSEATAAGWQLVTSSPLRRVYHRLSETRAPNSHDDEVALTYDSETAKVEINFHPLWQTTRKR